MGRRSGASVQIAVGDRLRRVRGVQRRGDREERHLGVNGRCEDSLQVLLATQTYVASRSLAVKMRLALLLAAALGVHADVQAPDMDPERKAEIAKKVREFQEMTRQNPALARPNTDALASNLPNLKNEL